MWKCEWESKKNLPKSNNELAMYFSNIHDVYRILLWCIRARFAAQWLKWKSVCDAGSVETQRAIWICTKMLDSPVNWMIFQPNSHKLQSIPKMQQARWSIGVGDVIHLVFYLHETATAKWTKKGERNSETLKPLVSAMNAQFNVVALVCVCVFRFGGTQANRKHLWTVEATPAIERTIENKWWGIWIAYTVCPVKLNDAELIHTY